MLSPDQWCSRGTKREGSSACPKDEFRWSQAGTGRITETVQEQTNRDGQVEEEKQCSGRSEPLNKSEALRLCHDEQISCCYPLHMKSEMGWSTTNGHMATAVRCLTNTDCQRAACCGGRVCWPSYHTTCEALREQHTESSDTKRKPWTTRSTGKFQTTLQQPDDCPRTFLCSYVGRRGRIKNELQRTAQGISTAQVQDTKLEVIRSS